MRYKILLTLAILTVYASLGINETSAQPPNQKPIKQQKEVTEEEIYKRFITEDVPYIITKAEIDAFKKLETNEERENFIALFWKRRDTNPDTEENEYREEYYERIAYANDHFTAGIPGWKTDRGRIYITRGKPDSIESRPSGGSYERPTYEGGGSTTTYPFETWFYRNVDSVGNGIEIEFVDPTGTGEYRIARSANDKDALLNIPGAGNTLRETLGFETRADRITGNGGGYQREQDSLMNRMILINDMLTPPKVGGFDKILDGVNTGVMENGEVIDFDVRVDFFRLSDEHVIASFSVLTKNKELSFKDVGGIQTAKMNITGIVTQVSGKRSGMFQDSVTTTSSADELAAKRFNSSIYQKAVTLTPGVYKTEVIARDVESGKTGVRKVGFTVPRYVAEKLSSSTLILASKLYETSSSEIGEMFIIAGKKVVPNISAEYKRGEEVGIYLQIYNAGIDQTTLRPSTEVNYVLLKDGREVLTQKEDWGNLSESGQRLILATFLSTEKLAPGEYELKIKIKDQVSNQEIAPSGKFHLQN